MSLSPQWLDELRMRVSLSGVIGRTTRLTKAGREFKACCPFHNEKSPSFTVNDEKGFYHCLAGETRVHTRDGLVPIAELAGRSVDVLSRNGQWLTGVFRDYGVQPLLRILLTRNGQHKQVYATAGHRWFVRGRMSAITTDGLKPGHRLESAFPVASSDAAIEAEGVRHGIVFGDGTLYKQRYGTLNLHGEKDRQLAEWFPDQKHHALTRDGGQDYLRVYGGTAFAHMKQLPTADADPNYLRGFLAGYLAADGHVAKDGTVILNSARMEVLEAVRELAHRIGIASYGITTQTRRGLGAADSDIHRIHFLRSTLAPEMVLLAEARERFVASRHRFERRRWVVRAVEVSERVETVYCAEVPGEHAFAIEDNILTGNCFGCGAHGDAIRWMTDQQGLSFMDAIKELAAEAGMEVPAPDPRAAKKAEAQAGLHDVMAAAQLWFAEQLQSAEGGKARAYLGTRGFDAHTVARFGFGYAPEGRQALKAALAQFPEGMLVEAGLRIVVDDDKGGKREPYDRFRGRLMLPIHDARGRVIAFGGRILDAEKKDAPKYLNSPDTPLFDKGRTLYNLHRAGPVSRQSGRLLVVEGYMDAIALSAAGIGEVVAPLGTAMTETQIELAWRLVENPVLCFDGDAAGQRAAMRAAVRALPLLRPAHSLRIVRLPAGMDPDDLIRRDGVGAMTRVLEGSIGLADLLWEHELAAGPLASPEDKAGLKARLLAHCDAIADPDIKALYRKDLLDRYGAFAFPRREAWTPPVRQNQPRGAGRRFGAPPEPTRPFQETMARMAQPAGAVRRAQALGAVAAGLVRLPEEIARQAEALAVLAREDARIDLLVSMEERGEALESDRIDTICAERGIAPPAQGQAREMAFSFLSEDSGAARAELAEVIDILVARPALTAALAKATEAGIATDEDWREQQRLREQMRALEKRELDLQGRLGQMAGANRYNSEDEQP